MESIFFEKQEGALCAQHALNALLQGAYFTAVDLATIARTLDVEEREVMGQGGVDSPEYLRAFQQDSFNMDDTGYFSVQVISAALRVWNLRLVPFTAADDPIACAALADPTTQNAYICNFREHWFTVRKFATQQWFNLNSVLNGPELISPTYLHMFLSQLQREGYSIFVVEGQLPQCQADVDLLTQPTPGRQVPEADDELQAAIAMSLGRTGRRSSTPDQDTTAALEASAQELDNEDASLKEAIAQSLAQFEDEDLKAALLLSMQNGMDTQPSSSSTQPPSTLNPQVAPAATAEASNPADLRAKRAAFLERLQSSDSRDPNEKNDKK